MRAAVRQLHFWSTFAALVSAVGFAACGGDEGGERTVIIRETQASKPEPKPEPEKAEPDKTIEDTEPAQGGEGDGAGELGVELPATFTAAEVLSFEQRVGQPQWVERARNRAANGVWEFDGNGGASFNTIEVRTDVYPLTGTYEVNGSRISFSVNGQSQTGYTGIATGEMIGSVDTSSDPPTLEFTWANGMGTGAVINETKFGSTATNGYVGTVALSQTGLGGP